MGKFIEIKSTVEEILVNSDYVESIEPYDKMYSNMIEHKIVIAMTSFGNPDYGISYTENYDTKEERDMRYMKLKKKLT